MDPATGRTILMATMCENYLAPIFVSYILTGHTKELFQGVLCAP